MRGEQPNSSGKVLKSIGSSPRARGTADFGSTACVRNRFIPACAGNRTLPPSSPTAPPVHPRVRGEQRRWRLRRRMCPGSSPRARGTAARPFDEKNFSRFIPACAGNSRHRIRPSHSRPVHPRVRGEQGIAVDADQDYIGSSPRARGTDDTQDPQFRAPRFIPACAGNRRLRHRRASVRSVHPRVRGEQLRPDDRQDYLFGSSPRARGTDTNVSLKNL